jgi:hypothetical protein
MSSMGSMKQMMICHFKNEKQEELPGVSGIYS